MSRTLRFFLLAVALVIIAACTPAAQQGVQKVAPDVVDFKSCVAAGYPVMKSYPPRCAGKNGKIYTDDVIRNIEGRACVDNCGNGQCEQIVCQAAGCPCAETPVNCAKDCVDSSF